MAERVLTVDLGLDATDEDIVGQMRVMKSAREGNLYTSVVCTVRGYGDDPRELWDVPEVKTFCRRLVRLGFISYLDVFSSVPPGPPGMSRLGFGAGEVWLTSLGLMRPKVWLTPDLLKEVWQAVARSNAVADAAVGPMREPAQ